MRWLTKSVTKTDKRRVGNVCSQHDDFVVIVQITY
jgi:hypothetical protein